MSLKVSRNAIVPMDVVKVKWLPKGLRSLVHFDRNVIIKCQNEGQIEHFASKRDYLSTMSLML